MKSRSRNEREFKIRAYSDLMKALARLEVADVDVLVVRTLLRPYLRGVESHFDQFAPGQEDEWQAHREAFESRARAYWTNRLLRALRAPLEQRVASVIRPGS